MFTSCRLLVLAWFAVAVALAGEPNADGLLHLSTDKLIYRPGETVHLRGFALTQLDHRPLDGHYPLQVTVMSPRGDRLPGGTVLISAGTLGGTWQLPDNAAGGTWRILVAGSQYLAPAERSIAVQALHTPTLINELSFRRDSYRAGDEIIADLTVRHAAGGAAVGTPVTIIARLGGNEIHRSQATVAADGRVLAQVKLPPQLTSADATLSCVVGLGSASETASRPIPLAALPPDLRLYPEGGELVAGLATRIYAEAFLANGHPAAFAGEILDDQGAVVTSLASVHEGRGRCALIPAAGRSYRLVLREPLVAAYPLSPVLGGGGVLGAVDEVTAPGAPLRLLVASSIGGRCLILVRKRSIELASLAIDTVAGQPQSVSIPLVEQEDGVLAVTLFGPDDVPLAERLIFRRSHSALAVSVNTDRVDYLADGTATLTVTTRDAAGKPVSALVALTVSDDALRTRVPRRERTPRLPAMVLLEGDVRELADADAYLDPRDPQSVTALDLLLGTQGWRRFAHRHPNAFLSGFGTAARRALGWGGGADVPTPGRPLSSVPDGAQVPGRDLDVPVNAEVNAGREEAVSASDMGSTGAFMAIGAGGGSAGMFGSRTGGGKRRALAKNGGSRASESAVDAALRWFKRHQSPDDKWSLTDYPNNCTEMPRCEPGPAWRDDDGDVAATALVTLCFLGTGYDHKTPNKYKTTLGKGLAWLRAHQRADDTFANGTWAHALATQALAEAYAMTNDPDLKAPAQRGVKALIARWQETSILGWSDTLAGGTPCPTIATLAAVNALRSAMAGGLNVGDAMERAKHRLHTAWNAANPGISMWTDAARLTCRFPARWDLAAAPDGPQQLGAGARLASMLGGPDSDIRQALDAATAARESFARKPWRLLSSQAGALALVQRGGAQWQIWNKTMHDPLVDAQRRGEGCFDGSWDHDGDPDSPDGGRLFSTAHACRALQSYYTAKNPANDRSNTSLTMESLVSECYEFAHRAPPRTFTDPVETDTVYWHRGLRTAPGTGSATVSFSCQRRPAVLRVLADAVGNDGVLGSADTTIAVVPDVTIAMRVPTFATIGDRVQAPVSVHQRSGGLVSAIVTCYTEGGVTAGILPLIRTTSANAPDGPGAELLSLTMTRAGNARVELVTRIEEQMQRITGRIAVRPAGFPWEFDRAGVLETDARHALTVSVPADVMDGGVTATLRLYADPALDAIHASERLQRDPTGCFEQTTSALYPMLMAQRLLLKMPAPPLDLLRRGQEFIARGADRLPNFLSPNGGFGWYGRDGDPVLTAYGLMILADLRAVGCINQRVQTDAHAWLLKQRDSRGGFLLGRLSGNNDRAVANAYVVWGLLDSAGDDRRQMTGELGLELDALTASARVSRNAYEIALTANVLVLAGRANDATAVRALLVQEADGRVTGATASAIGSHGLSLDIETTALACLAWSSAGAGARTQALDAARYLRSQCQDGRFSTTQATVLALRALLVEQHDRDTKPGTVALTVDGREPLSLHIDPRRLSITDPLIVTLGPGTHTIGITQSEGGRLPWSLHLSGHVARPVSDPACPLRLVTTLSRARLPVGEPLECTVTVINANAAAVRSPIAVIPLPGGVDADPEQLRGLVRAGRIAASEVRDGAVVLYFETLAASETRVVPLALVASVPGSYSAPAARAYAYYQDELKWWCTPLTVEIDARR